MFADEAPLVVDLLLRDLPCHVEPYGAVLLQLHARQLALRSCDLVGEPAVLVWLQCRKPRRYQLRMLSPTETMTMAGFHRSTLRTWLRLGFPIAGYNANINLTVDSTDPPRSASPLRWRLSSGIGAMEASWADSDLLPKRGNKRSRLGQLARPRNSLISSA